MRGEEEIGHLLRLFCALERQEDLLNLLDSVMGAEGVQVFSGSESADPDLSGCAIIMSPYGNHQGAVIGAIGVLGPVRMCYTRIIPMVNYTAK